MKSRIEVVLPSLDIPYTAREDPIRAKDRKLSAEPRNKKSSTASEEPKRDTPKTDRLLPARQ